MPAFILRAINRRHLSDVVSCGQVYTLCINNSTMLIRVRAEHLCLAFNHTVAYFIVIGWLPSSIITTWAKAVLARTIAKLR